MCFPFSEFCILGCPGEGLDIADVGHAGQVHDGPLKTEAEPGVRTTAETADIEIPPVVEKAEKILGAIRYRHLRPAYYQTTPQALSSAHHSGKMTNITQPSPLGKNRLALRYSA